MKVLGIDPGSLYTGYGIVQKGGNGQLIHVRDGRISVKGSLPLHERLLTISKELTKIIEDERPEAISIESVFFAKNVKSAITLGEARGVALLSAASIGVPIFEYAPTSIKLSVTGYGNASKEEMQKMVKMLLKRPEVAKPDAADALAIAICHINHSNTHKIIKQLNEGKKPSVKGIALADAKLSPV